MKKYRIYRNFCGNIDIDCYDYKNTIIGFSSYITTEGICHKCKMAINNKVNFQSIIRNKTYFFHTEHIPDKTMTKFLKLKALYLLNK